MITVAQACLEAGITVADAKSNSRRHVLTRRRYHVMAILRERNAWSYPRIGKALGNRDHATIIYGVRRHAELTAATEGAPA